MIQALRRWFRTRSVLEDALDFVDEQWRVIDAQRIHIAQLDARIAKMEHEADGLRQLL